MRIINLSEQNTILNRFVSELRDVNIQKDSMRFRRNVERIGETMAYEISKTLNYAPLETQTPLGTSITNVPTDPIVIATIRKRNTSSCKSHHRKNSFHNRTYLLLITWILFQIRIGNQHR